MDGGGGGGVKPLELVVVVAPGVVGGLPLPLLGGVPVVTIGEVTGTRKNLYTGSQYQVEETAASPRFSKSRYQKQTVAARSVAERRQPSCSAGACDKTGFVVRQSALLKATSRMRVKQ